MPRGMLIRVLTHLALLQVALLIGGCGGNDDDAFAQYESMPPKPNLLGFTSPVTLLKAVSADDADRICRGADYAAELPNQRVLEQGTQLTFLPIWIPGGNPENDDLACAMYAFALQDYLGPPELTFHWGLAPPDFAHCFVGLGNQVRNQWVWFNGADLDDGLLTVPDLAPYLDGEGRLLLAMVLIGTDICTLSWLRWGGNVSPVAQLTADPASGPAPLTVNFDASSSVDLDGTVVNYEWDFNENNIFNEGGDEADAEGSSSAAFTYGEDGEYTAKVQVTDSDGASNVAEQQIVVATGEGWIFVTLDSMQGLNISLAVINGNPAISYAVGNGGGSLIYAWSTTATGKAATDWSTPVVIDETDAYWDNFLAEVDGAPAIACWCREESSAEQQLRYFRSTTSSGADAADWQSHVTVDTSTPYVPVPTLEVVAGNPAIAYYITGGSGLWYLRASTSTGASAADWGSPLFIDKGGGSKPPFLAVVDGNPAIAYNNAYGTAPDFRPAYVRATTATGADAVDWSEKVYLNEIYGSPSGNLSMAIVAGHPAICYQGGSPFLRLRYIRSTTSTGTDATAWSNAVTVDTMQPPDTQFQWVALNVVHGRPLIAYGETHNWELLSAHSATSTGDAEEDWSERATLATDAFPDASMAIVNGNPAFCFYDTAVQVLKYAYYDP